MILSKGIDFAGEETLGRRYTRDGKGFMVRAAISPCDCVEENCERGIHCVIEERAVFDARVEETMKLFSAMTKAVNACQGVFQAWHQRATTCQEIGTITSRPAWQTYATKERRFVWPSGGCQEFLEKDEELDVQLSAIFQLTSRFVTWMQDTRSLVRYIDLPIQVSAPQIDANVPCDDVKATAQVAAPPQTASAGKSRGDK